MALIRLDVEVTGTAEAEAALRGVDGTARDAADALRLLDRGFGGSEDAAEKADRAFEQAGASSGQLDRLLAALDATVRRVDAGLDALASAATRAARAKRDAAGAGKEVGGAFEGINSGVKKALDPFGDVVERMGQVEDIFRVFSGFVVFEAVDAIAGWAQELYAATDAGKEAARWQKAVADALGDVKGRLDALAGSTDIEALDPERYARLGAAIATVKEEEEEYTAALQTAIEAQLRVNEARADYERVKANPDAARFGEGVAQEAKELGAFERALTGAKTEAEKLRASLIAKRDAAEQVTREIEGATKASQEASRQWATEARQLVDGAVAWGEYWQAVARGSAGSTGLADNVIRWHASFANAIEDTVASVGKAIAAHDSRAEAARREAAALAKLREEQARTFATDETVAVMELDLDALELEAVGAVRKDPLDDPTVDALVRAIEEQIQDGMHGLDLTLPGGFDLAAALDGELKDPIEESSASFEQWADVASQAIGSVASAVGSIGDALAAVTESRLAPLRNELTKLEEGLEAAEAAERLAQSERDRARSAEEIAAADEKIASAGKKRAAAEQGVYQAKLALIDAEEEAAEQAKRIKVLEMALQGAQAAADALKMGALALEFGSKGNIPGAVAAGASAVAYIAAAAAYGVGAAAVASTPTARQQRPTAPGADGDEIGRPDDASRRGAGRGNGDGVTYIVNVTAGAIVSDKRDLGAMITDGIDELSRDRGRPRANFAAMQSRGRR